MLWWTLHFYIIYYNYYYYYHGLCSVWILPNSLSFAFVKCIFLADLLLAVVLEDLFFYNYIWLIFQFGQIWGREGGARAPSCTWATCWQSLCWRTWSAACRRTSWVPGSTGAGPGKQQTVSFGGFFEFRGVFFYYEIISWNLKCRLS